MPRRASTRRGSIALNQLDDGAPLPPQHVHADARRRKRRAASSRGSRATPARSTVAVIGSDTPLQKRFAAAFVDEWLLAGGAAPVTLRFDRAPETLALLKRELARTPLDAALLAVDAPTPRCVKPYVGTIATYASSQVNDRQPPRDRCAISTDVRFVEIPWLADPDAARVREDRRGRALPNAALDRLYALGIDAFRVAQALADGRGRPRSNSTARPDTSRSMRTRQFAREGRAAAVQRRRDRAGRRAP